MTVAAAVLVALSLVELSDRVWVGDTPEVIGPSVPMMFPSFIDVVESMLRLAFRKSALAEMGGCVDDVEDRD